MRRKFSELKIHCLVFSTHFSGSLPKELEIHIFLKEKGHYHERISNFYPGVLGIKVIGSF